MTNEELDPGEVQHRRYWSPGHVSHNCGYDLEARAGIAFTIMEKWAMVSGKPGVEDSAGRQTIELLPVAEVIDRAFCLADAFMERCELRGEVKGYSEDDCEAAFKRGGELARIQNDAQYPSRAEKTGRLVDEFTEKIKSA